MRGTLPYIIYRVQYRGIICYDEFIGFARICRPRSSMQYYNYVGTSENFLYIIYLVLYCFSRTNIHIVIIIILVYYY